MYVILSVKMHKNKPFCKSNYWNIVNTLEKSLHTLITSFAAIKLESHFKLINIVVHWKTHLSTEKYICELKSTLVHWKMHLCTDKYTCVVIKIFVHWEILYVYREIYLCTARLCICALSEIYLYTEKLIYCICVLRDYITVHWEIYTTNPLFPLWIYIFLETVITNKYTGAMRNLLCTEKYTCALGETNFKCDPICKRSCRC